MAIGGKGVVSVVANIVPKITADTVLAWENGDIERSRELFYKLLPLCQAMFFETNPVPVKTSLALMGKIDENIRLPLAKMQDNNLNKLKEVLKSYKLI